MNLKHFRPLIVGLGCALVSSAYAQTAKTRAELYAEADSLFADAGATEITPADLRLSLKNIVASAANVPSDGTAVVTGGSYANPAWITSLAFSKLTGVPASLTLLGISNGAALDAIGANGGSFYLSRDNHTGTQGIATISGLQAALDGKLASSATAADVNPAGSAIAAALAGKLSTSGTAADVNVSGTAIAAALAGKLGTSAAAADVNPAGTAIAAALAGKLATSGTAADVNPAGTSIAAALAAKAASSHTHPASQISDSTTVGRAVLTAADQAAGRSAIGAGTSSFSGAYADLSGKPTLGTAAPLNVAASGNAASGEVVKGDDSRLSDARTPTSHMHTAADVTDFNSSARAQVEAALVAGTNVTLTPSGSGASRQITIASSGSSGGAGTLSITLVTSVFTNLPASVGFWAGSAGHQYGVKVDLTNFTQVRFLANKQAVAGTASSKIHLRYHTSLTTTAATYSDIGTSAVELAVNTATVQILDTGWIDLAAGAKADVVIMPLGSGGDGVTDPTFGSVVAQFK